MARRYRAEPQDQGAAHGGGRDDKKRHSTGIILHLHLAMICCFGFYQGIKTERGSKGNENGSGG